MFFHEFRKLTSVSLLITCFFTGSSQCIAASNDIADLLQGEIAYQFQLGNYFQAISQSLTASSSGYIEPTDRDGALLNASLYMSYGMHHKADKLLETLKKQGSDNTSLLQAQVKLADYLFQRGRYQDALSTLPVYSEYLSGSVSSEYRAARIPILLSLGREDEVSNMPASLEDAAGWDVFSRYNLAMGLFKSGRTDDARAVLKEVIELDAVTLMQINLRDKANYEMALSYIEASQLGKAKEYLQQIHLHGLSANKALLATGWVNSQLGNDDIALKLWRGLQRRSIEDIAVQESYLAVPHILSGLQAHTESLRAYENSLALYSTEIFRIDEAVQSINEGGFKREFLRAVEINGGGRSWDFSTLEQYPEKAYIKDVIASSEFRETIKDYRDTRLLIRAMEKRVSDLDVFQQALKAKQEYLSNDWSSKIQGLPNSASIDAINTQRNSLIRQVEAIEDSGDENLLMTSEEKRQYAVLNTLGDMINRQADDVSVEAFKKRYQRLKAIILWNANVNYSARLVTLKGSVSELNAAIQGLGNQAASVNRHWARLPADILAKGKRIKQKHKELMSIINKASSIEVELAGSIEGLVLNALKNHGEKLRDYRTQARFAVAQLHDRESLGAQQK